MTTVATMALRELTRRRGVLALLVLLPLSFYLVRRDLPGQSIRFLALGIAWTISTLSLFGACAARSVDRRLRLTGYSTLQLAAGRLLAAQISGLALATGYFAIVLLDQDVRRAWAVGLLLATTAILAAPVGALIAGVVARELEGALALLIVVATQMLADPAGSIAPWLPFWSTRELATYAIDGTATPDLVRGLLHATATLAVTVTGAMALSAGRLRLSTGRAPRGPSTPGPAAQG